MDWLLKLIAEEPVAFYGVLRALIVVSVSFGLRLTPEQIGGVYLFSEALLSFLTRRKVTPTG